jgi:1,4-dihydroxy-2-naphthoate polyprenyltransferase
MIAKYLKMIRLHIVAGGIVAFTVGALLALVNGGVFVPLRFVVFYMMIFFGDLSTHFGNDYFDVEADRLSNKKSVLSGSKVLVANPQMMRSVRVISLSLLCLSLLSAVLAVAFQLAPVEFLLVAVGVNFLGWFYSAPPIRFVSRGLGEVAIALAVGVGIPAAGYLSAMGHYDGWFGLFALPFLLYGFMLAFSLEAPDTHMDRLSDKKTLGAIRGNLAVFCLAFVVALVALIFFVAYALWFGVWVVDFYVFAVFAVVPTILGLVGWVSAYCRKKAELLSLVNVLSLFVINLLIVVYLLAVLLS